MYNNIDNDTIYDVQYRYLSLKSNQWCHNYLGN